MTSDAITMQLINQLGGIANTLTADGESRIKAAVMRAYLSGHYRRNSASS